jgi:flavin-binding protein dodecin
MEITSQSPEGFDHAIKLGLERASKTVQGIRGAWIKDQQLVVEGGQIRMYRVDMKLTFELRD